MVKFSNNIVGLINFLVFVLSIPILIAGIWLTRQTTTCQHFLEKPVIAIAVFLMIVSLAGLIGACCRVTCLLWLYLFVMFLLIVILFAFTVFTFVVTNKGAGEAVSGKGYKEYRLGDYSNWLQKRVDSQKNWGKIESCLVDSKVCQSLLNQTDNTPVDTFYKSHLTALQSGCCKPPDSCNFTYVSPTNWTKTETTYSNPDCAAWDNNPDVLCYNCQSCKAGVLDNIKHDWKKVAIVNIIFLVFIIVIYSIGCHAFRNNMREGSYRRYP